MKEEIRLYVLFGVIWLAALGVLMWPYLFWRE